MKFNETILNQVITEAKTKAAGNRRWIAAIDRAVEGLQSGRWYVTELVNETIVTTENGTYHVNGHCGCKAGALGQPCKHRAAKRLLEMYNEDKASRDALSSAPADERAELIADITATWLRRFPGESLSDNLMARFKVNALGFLNTDFLRRVFDAIA